MQVLQAPRTGKVSCLVKVAVQLLPSHIVRAQVVQELLETSEAPSHDVILDDFLNKLGDLGAGEIPLDKPILFEELVGEFSTRGFIWLGPRLPRRLHLFHWLRRAAIAEPAKELIEYVFSLEWRFRSGR